VLSWPLRLPRGLVERAFAALSAQSNLNNYRNPPAAFKGKYAQDEAIFLCL